MTNHEREVAIANALGVLDIVAGHRAEFGQTPETVHMTGASAERMAKALIMAESGEMVRLVCEAVGQPIPNVDEW